MINQKQIRNFCIISHIDHGKSTLADRLLEITGTVDKREMHEQYLDMMDLEREKGITIKMQPVRMEYQVQDSKYILNLIDTPGHVDFAYEVSRSLAACEGAILIVDATQGIQAQTLNNIYLALEHDLKIIPVVNKIDLSLAEPEKTASEIEKIFGIAKEEIIFISAKTGKNVDQVLEAVIDIIPAPKNDLSKPLRALIFDSNYDRYKGVIAYVRLFDGEIRKDEKIILMADKKETDVSEVGYFKPNLSKSLKLSAGEIGFIATGLKEVSECRVGDTITINDSLEVEPLSGYKEPKPMIFAGIFPTENDNFNLLKSALEKLKLNDASLSFEPTTSTGLGFGFKCGFLGLLHLEIIKERLEREFDLDLIVTSPSVSYKIYKTNGKIFIVNNPIEYPDPSEIKKIEEPYVKVEIITPSKYLGGLMELVNTRRGIYKETKYLDDKRALLVYELPLSEIVITSPSLPPFYDQLKSISSGYASMNYELIGYRESSLAKLDIFVAHEKSEAFSQIVFADNAYSIGRALVKRLKELIPKQMFAVALQAAIGNKVIARETISALKKDVTAKLYGGDYTRKSKLLEKQRKGKKKMKNLGKVSIPTDTLFKLLK